MPKIKDSAAVDDVSQSHRCISGGLAQLLYVLPCHWNGLSVEVPSL